MSRLIINTTVKLYRGVLCQGHKVDLIGTSLQLLEASFDLSLSTKGSQVLPYQVKRFKEDLSRCLLKRKSVIREYYSIEVI